MDVIGKEVINRLQFIFFTDTGVVKYVALIQRIRIMYSPEPPVSLSVVQISANPVIFMLRNPGYFFNSADKRINEGTDPVLVQDLSYPASILVAREVLESDKPLRMAQQDAIPEFRRFNIMESEVRNVV